VQFQSSGCGVRLVARVRQRSGGWICRRQASPVACGVSTAAVDPATSWDEPGCPPLAPGSCEPPVDCCGPPLASGSCEPPGDCCAPPLTPASCEAPGCGPPLAPGNWEPPDCVSLPPEATGVARIQVASLRARPAAAKTATSRSRGPSRRTQTRTLRPGRHAECRLLWGSEATFHKQCRENLKLKNPNQNSNTSGRKPNALSQ
jgi:hypothetical protein